MNLSFIITGGAGFLGQHLTFNLLDIYPNCNIKVLDLKSHSHPIYTFDDEKRVSFLYGVDITKPETYITEIKKGADCLFNLVGYISFWFKDKDKLYRTNVAGVQKLLETAKDAGIKKVIHVSSVAAIGFKNDKLNPVDETFDVNWDKFKKKYYMYTKHLGEIAAQNFIKDGMNIVIVNPSLMYGPGDIHNTISLFKSLAKEKVPFYTPGGNSISDVRDIARGLIVAYEKGKSGDRYILASEHQPFEIIFKHISNAIGVKSPSMCLPYFLNILIRPIIKLIEIFSVKSPDLTADTLSFGFVFRYHSSAKAKKELGWEPKISSEQSMKDAVAWYLKEKLI